MGIMACRNCCADCFAPMRSLVKIRIITLIAIVEFILYQVVGFYAVSLYNLIGLFCGIFIYALAIATVFYYKPKEFLLVFSLYKVATIAVTTVYLIIWIDVIMVQCRRIEQNLGDNNQGTQFFKFSANPAHDFGQVINCLPVYQSAEQALVIVGLFVSIIFDLFFALMSFRYFRFLRQTRSVRQVVVSPITSMQSPVCRQESAEPMCQPLEVYGAPVDHVFPPTYRSNEMIVGRPKDDFESS